MALFQSFYQYLKDQSLSSSGESKSQLSPLSSFSTLRFYQYLKDQSLNSSGESKSQHTLDLVRLMAGFYLYLKDQSLNSSGESKSQLVTCMAPSLFSFYHYLKNHKLNCETTADAITYNQNVPEKQITIGLTSWNAASRSARTIYISAEALADAIYKKSGHIG